MAIYLSVLERADDFGRLSASPELWRGPLVMMMPHLTEDRVIAYQHDLACIRLVGFYPFGDSEFCQIYDYHLLIAARADRLFNSGLPTPPREQWPLIKHPRDCGRRIDPPGVPYEDYKAECRQWSPNREVFAPRTERPKVYPLVNLPEVTLPPTAVSSTIVPLFEDDGKIGHELYDEALGILKDIKSYPFDRDEDLKLVRTLDSRYSAKGVPLVTTLEHISFWVSGNPFKKGARPRAFIYNWFRRDLEQLQEKRGREGTTNSAPRRVESDYVGPLP